MEADRHSRAPVADAPRPAVSVVMPAFNCASYVDAAIESLTRQTLKEWECVCVDDGSTDDTASRLDAWAARDTRIRVLRQPNAGVSAARNSGLAHARGDFLFFLDADDLVGAEALERMVSVSRQTRADVVVGGLVMMSPDCAEMPAAPAKPEAVATYDTPIMPSLLSFRTLRFEACGKLYSRHRFADARFPIGVACAEDTFFWLSAAAAARRIVVCPDPLYGYRRTPGSASLNAASGRKYIAGSVAVAVHCHDLCVQHQLPQSTTNELIEIYGTNRIWTEVMRAAADSAVTTDDFRQLRSEAIAGIQAVRKRTGRRAGCIALQHRLTWLFTEMFPSRKILRFLWRLRNLRQSVCSAQRILATRPQPT